MSSNGIIWMLARLRFGRGPAALGLGLLTALTVPQAMAAMPVPPAILEEHSDIIPVQTVCDTRGCFTYGPRQSYHRPNYRPLGQTGPNYYRPRAVAPQPFVYQPPTRAIRPVPPLPAATLSRHRQWCMNRYRSYDPLTDRYVAAGGRTALCNSPQRP